MKRLAALAICLLCLTAPAHAALDDYGSGSLTAGSPQWCKPLTTQPATAVLYVTGTWSGVVTFQVVPRSRGLSPDPTQAQAVLASDFTSRTMTQTATANGTFVIPVAGFSSVCANFTTPTSGTVAVFAEVSTAPYPALAAGPAVDGSTPAATVNALCVTPAAGCAAGQAASIKVTGRNSVSAEVVTSALTATFTPYISTDNGATWVATAFRTNGNGFSSLSNTAATNALAASTATLYYWIPLAMGGVTDVMLAVTAYTSGSATVAFTSSNTSPNPLLFTTVPKGLQPLNSVGISTQDLKDSGRAFVVLGADGVTPAIADTVITFSKNVAGTVTGAQTTYAITSGKTLRLQAVTCSFTAGATANIVRVRLRLNTGGACVVGSGLLLPAMELAPNYGTATASEGQTSEAMAIPDGLELSGTNWNICLSESAVAASGTLTCNVIGYEY